MKKKYIIDLNPDCVEGEYLRIPARIAGEEQWLVTKAALTPYTEPDLEQVRKEAYEKGYGTGYEDGYNEPGKNQQEAYQRGLNDAWDAAKKTADMYSEERRKIFGENFIQKIYGIYSAAEVIEKLQVYEQAQLAKLRDRLTAFCMKHHCANCPLNTNDFSCGKGLSFKPCYEGDKDIIPNDELEVYAAAAGLASQE